MHLLLVEDDARLARALVRLLRDDRHVVDVAGDGTSAIELVETANGSLDAMILDIGLPDISGLEVARRVRSAGSNLGILAHRRDAIGDRVAGLDAGPTTISSRLAVRRAGRPTSGPRPGCERPAKSRRPAARERVDRPRRAEPAVTLAGQEIALSRQEFALLECLLRNPGRVLSGRAARPGLAGRGGPDPELGRGLYPLPPDEARDGRRPDRDGPRRRLPAVRPMTEPGVGGPPVPGAASSPPDPGATTGPTADPVAGPLAPGASAAAAPSVSTATASGPDAPLLGGPARLVAWSAATMLVALLVLGVAIYGAAVRRRSTRRAAASSSSAPPASSGSSRTSPGRSRTGSRTSPTSASRSAAPP